MAANVDLSREQVMEIYWSVRRQEIIDWLIREKKFNPKAAPKCADNFIETMLLMDKETRRCF